MRTSVRRHRSRLIRGRFGRSDRSRLVLRDDITADGCVLMVRNGLSSAPALVPGPDTDSWQGRSSARPDHHRGQAGPGRQLNLAASPFASPLFSSTNSEADCSAASNWRCSRWRLSSLSLATRTKAPSACAAQMRASLDVRAGELVLGIKAEAHGRSSLNAEKLANFIRPGRPNCLGAPGSRRATETLRADAPHRQRSWN